MVIFANISMLRINLAKFAVKKYNMAYKEVSKWLNVKFVARAFISVTT